MGGSSVCSPLFLCQFKNPAFKHDVLPGCVLVEADLLRSGKSEAESCQQPHRRGVVQCGTGGKMREAAISQVGKQCCEGLLGIALAVVCRVEAVPDLMAGQSVVSIGRINRRSV